MFTSIHPRRAAGAAGGALAVTASLLALAGQGQARPTPAASSTRLTVFGAASLSKVFPRIAPNEKYSFAGSGTLETQIEQGAPADVFAAASPKQTTALYRTGLATKPRVFATNTLVMIVPRDNPAGIRSVGDVTRKGVKIVVCDASQPCGDYASTAFENLGITKAADRNVVSQEADVSDVVAQIANGEGDVGFVYITDAKSAGAKVKVIRLPARAKPVTQDTVSVIRHSSHRAAADAFVSQLLSARAQAKLQAAGFGRP